MKFKRFPKLVVILPIYGIVASILPFVVDKNSNVYEYNIFNFGVSLITVSISQNNLWLTYPELHYTELFLMYAVINCIIWIPLSFLINETYNSIKNK